MDGIVFTIIGTVLGGLISFGISAWYYKRSSKDAKEINEQTKDMIEKQLVVLSNLTNNNPEVRIKKINDKWVVINVAEDLPSSITVNKKEENK